MKNLNLKFGLALASLCGLTSGANAQTTWTGASSSVWTTAGNWDNGTPGTSKGAVFDTPTANMPITDTQNRITDSITFNQAGWTIGTDGPGYVQLRGDSTPANPVISNGIGTNTIGNLAMHSSAGSSTVTTGSGNTLVIQNSPSLLKFASKSGDGTLVIGAGATIENGIGIVNAGTLLINGTSSIRSFAHVVTTVAGTVIGGSGFIQENNSATTDFTGSTLAPGSAGLNDTAAGILTFTRDPATVVNGRDWDINLNSATVLAINVFGDGTSDSLAFLSTGDATTDITLTINTGVTLDLSGAAAFDTEYIVMTFAASGGAMPTYSGAFDTVKLNGATLTEGADYTFNYAADKIGVTLLIPEPSTAILLLGGVGVLGLLRRRRLS